MFSSVHSLLYVLVLDNVAELYRKFYMWTLDFHEAFKRVSLVCTIPLRM